MLLTFKLHCLVYSPTDYFYCFTLSSSLSIVAVNVIPSVSKGMYVQERKKGVRKKAEAQRGGERVGRREDWGRKRKMKMLEENEKEKQSEKSGSYSYCQAPFPVISCGSFVSLASSQTESGFTSVEHRCLPHINWDSAEALQMKQKSLSGNPPLPCFLPYPIFHPPLFLLLFIPSSQLLLLWSM